LVGPPGGKSNVELLVDASSSMNGRPAATNCTWYGNLYNGGDTTLKKIDQRAAPFVLRGEDVLHTLEVSGGVRAAHHLDDFTGGKFVRHFRV
jgi:hypothetical protein